MRCAACGHHNPDDSQFCESCGDRLQHPCTACGRPLSAEAHFCNHCGVSREADDGSEAPHTESGSRSEYRLLTVLFCDLVGSTELGELLDPEELRDIMREYQTLCGEALEAYDGYIAQYRGDGVLAYFGYPKAHEDDAERAVRGALELQAKLSERLGERGVRARIGIHTGQVIVSDIGNETLAHGSAMNLAARIESVAEAGGVAISEATQSLTAGIFVTRALGEHDLKGIDHPVGVYAVDRVLGGRRPRPDAESPLIGRERELGLLRERFELASEGNGQVVVVSGEPGIGKSRLALAFRDAIRTSPHTWIDMQCSPFSSGSALRPVIDMFEERVRIREDEPAEARSEFLARGLAGLPRFEVEPVLPYLFSLLGLPQLDGHPMPTVSPELQRERTMEALCAIVEALAHQQTVVIEIEDLHWVDPSTLEYLGRLVDLAPTQKLMLLCTARPEFEVTWHRSHVEHLQLARLRRGATLEMIQAVAGGRRLPEDLAEKIAERSDGVPLFIEELSRAVLDPEVGVRRGDGVDLRPGAGEPAIPMTLKGSLMERLDRLSSAKRVAQLGATIGHEFSYELIEKVGEVAPPALSSGLSQLVEAEILYERGRPPDAHYTFKHVLLRDTAYHSQLRSDRRQTHARVAQILERDFGPRVSAEPALAAHHYAEAGLHDQAAAHYQAAAVLASSRYANEEALGFTDAALAELDGLPEGEDRWGRELTARISMTAPLVALRGFAHPEVEEVNRQITDLCDRRLDGEAGLPGLLALAQYYQRRGDPKRAADMGRRILSIGVGVGNPMVEVVGNFIVGASNITIAQSSEAIAHVERAVEVGRSIDMPPPTTPLQPHLMSFIFATAGVALASGGYPDRAAAYAWEARESALAQNHEPTVIHTLAMSIITHYMLEDHETTIAWAREVIELCRDRGFHGPEAEARTNLGWARVALGDDGGIDDVEAGLARALDSGFLGGICQNLQAGADANRLAGRTRRAHELIDRSLEACREAGESICFEGRARRVRALTLLAEGAPDEAEAEFLKALEVLTRYGARLECLMVATELLRLARGRDNEAEARDRLAGFYAALEGERELRSLRAARVLLAETGNSA